MCGINRITYVQERFVGVHDDRAFLSPQRPRSAIECVLVDRSVVRELLAIVHKILQVQHYAPFSNKPQIFQTPKQVKSTVDLDGGIHPSGFAIWNPSIIYN